MRIETCGGTYNIELDADSIKRMEMNGLKPIKKLSEIADDPLGNIEYTYIVKVFEICGTHEVHDGPEVATKGIEKDMLDSGYGLLDFVNIFKEVFTSSPFLGRTRTPISSENASETERIDSENGTPRCAESTE